MCISDHPHATGDISSVFVIHTARPFSSRFIIQLPNLSWNALLDLACSTTRISTPHLTRTGPELPIKGSLGLDSRFNGARARYY